MELLIEPATGMLIPVKIKLTEIPDPQLARTLATFRDSFGQHAPGQFRVQYMYPSPVQRISTPAALR